MLNRIKTILAWTWRLAKAQLALLIAAGIVVLGVWAFSAMGDEVLEHEGFEYDAYVLQHLRAADNPKDPVGPEWIEAAATDITALGGYTVTILLTLGVTAYLLLAGKGWEAVRVVVAIAAGFGWIILLKGFFDRDRPNVVPHLIDVSTPSFPSGHAMGSAVVFLTLGALLAQGAQRLRLKVFFITVAVLATLAVGGTRVYLGVHYPSDVLAGWAGGTAWATGVWAMAELVRRIRLAWAAGGKDDLKKI